MKRSAIIAILSFFIANFSFGQDLEKYSRLVSEADDLYEAEEYVKSAEKYKEAFAAVNGKAYSSDRYNGACSFALAGDVETAFHHLFVLAEGNVKYRDYDHITTDSDLDVLHTDPRWDALISQVKANKNEFEKDINKPLAAILDAIYEEDQRYRQQYMLIVEKYGWNSEEANNYWPVVEKADSINLIKVKAIIDEHGWLGPKTIGDRGNGTLFLVIQHSDPETREKYLPIMREAVKKRDASVADLALLEDRTALEQGRKQIYGSQIGRNEQTGEMYVLPLDDPDNVDKRRAEVGLPPIQNYVSNWNIIWDANEYKKRLPEYEAMQKK